MSYIAEKKMFIQPEPTIISIILLVVFLWSVDKGFEADSHLGN